MARALSERVKQAKQRQMENQKLSDALDEYTREQRKPDGEKRLSARAVAEKHGLRSHKTLINHHKGKRTMSAFNASKQRLTLAEEETLLNFLLESADRGFPLDYPSLRKHADAILRAKHGDSSEGVGEQWASRFLDRHRDELQTHWSKPLATERARALNPENVRSWFELVKKWLVDLGIRVEDIYGMDESGFPPSDQGTRRVIGRRGTKVQHKQGSGERENVTALVTICADGSTLKPTIVFKAKKFQASWRENNVSNASFAHSENGWTDGEIAMWWFVKDFDAQTREKADGRPRVLLVDGHSSHYTSEVLNYAIKHNIILLAYPPHCTHALQGLDVVCFARMKEIWKEEIREFEEVHMRGVKKADFAETFGKAFVKAFTPDTVRAAFEKTGIYPFNPDVISPEQMKPSKATSTQGTFPLPQPSPVRAVLQSWWTSTSNVPQEADTCPAEHALLPRSPIAGPSTFPDTPRTPTRPQPSGHHQLHSTSSRTRVRTPSVSSPESPSKRMRFMRANLAQTASGSFLVSDEPITSIQRIAAPVFDKVPQLPEPNWHLLSDQRDNHATKAELQEQVADLAESLRLAREQIRVRDTALEGSHAQLVVQNLYAGKLNVALNTKEKGKTDRALLFEDGKGRHLTDPEFIAKVDAIKEARVEEATAKTHRAAARKAKKDERAVLQRIWKDMCERHACARKAWEEECERLQAGGMAKKNLPKAPRKPRKPKSLADVPIHVEPGLLAADNAGEPDSTGDEGDEDEDIDESDS